MILKENILLTRIKRNYLKKKENILKKKKATELKKKHVKKKLVRVCRVEKSTIILKSITIKLKLSF